jgi:predicted transcriptional regulator
MTGLLEIEKQILEAVRTPMHPRLLRRIVANQYHDASIRHNMFKAYLDGLVTKGYIEPVSESHGAKYRLTTTGETAVTSPATPPAV